MHFKLRGRVVQGLGPIEALTQQQGEQRFLYNCVLWCKPSSSVMIKNYVELINTKCHVLLT